MAEVLMPRFTPSTLVLIALTALLVPSVALAQDGTAVSGWSSILAGARDSAIAAISVGLAGALGWIGLQFQKWTGITFDAKETKGDLDWEHLLDRASKFVFNLASVKLNITPDKLATWEEKERFLGVALRLFRQFYPVAADWMDKNQNGIPDFLEGHGANAVVDVDPVRETLEARLFESAPAEVFARPVAQPTGGTPQTLFSQPVDAARAPARAKPRSATEIARTFQASNKRPV